MLTSPTPDQLVTSHTFTDKRSRHRKTDTLDSEVIPESD